MPPDAVARAELAHRLGDKYRFRESDVGRLRAALASTTCGAQAYRDRHRGELTDVYDTDLSWREKAVVSRKAVPPPGGAAAVLDDLRPDPDRDRRRRDAGAADRRRRRRTAARRRIIVVLGLLNVLTVAAVAETFARTSSVRWRGAYFDAWSAGTSGEPAGSPSVSG